MIELLTQIKKSTENIGVNNELTEKANELLQNMKVQFINIVQNGSGDNNGGNNSSINNPDPYAFNLDSSSMHPILRGY